LKDQLDGATFTIGRVVAPGCDGEGAVASRRARRSTTIPGVTVPEPAEFHDPMPELIETIIRSMGGSGGSQAPASGTKALAPAFDAYLESLRILLPEPVDVRSAAVAEAQDFCESLAIIATVMATLANLVTGPISVAAQEVARSIGKPLAAAGMELALAAAKEITGGTLPPELAGRLSAQRVLDTVLGHVSPGTLELKIMAFALRLTGAALCLASGRPVTRCPCYPDLVSDTGTSVLGLPWPG
jgi:hypothetical protein